MSRKRMVAGVEYTEKELYNTIKQKLREGMTMNEIAVDLGFQLPKPSLGIFYDKHRDREIHKKIIVSMLSFLFGIIIFGMIRVFFQLPIQFVDSLSLLLGFCLIVYFIRSIK